MSQINHLALFCFVIALFVVVRSDDSDWANLARYNESDAQLALLPAGTNQVIFMGDSITDNWNSVTPFFPGKPFVNRGIGGQITPQMLVRMRPDVINLQPDVLLILGGINDIGMKVEALENIEGFIFSMAELAKIHKIQVIIASILPVCGDLMKSIHPPEWILEINDKLKAYAATNDVIYLDYFSAVVDANGDLRQELSLDCLHPNADGYAIMAPLALQAIDQALQKKSFAKSINERAFLGITY